MTGQQICLVHLRKEGSGALSTEIRASLKEARTAASFGRLIEWEDDSADFVIAAGHDVYQLQDPAGVPIPHLGTPFALADSAAPTKLMNQLIHLARYRDVAQRIRKSIQSPPQITFEWLDVPADHIYQTNDTARLRVYNKSNDVVDMMFLALADDWSIRQLFPATSVIVLLPRGSQILTLKTAFASSVAKATVNYQLFATAHEGNLHELELKPLNQPSLANLLVSATRLEKLLDRQWYSVPTDLRIRNHTKEVGGLRGGIKKCAYSTWQTRRIDLAIPHKAFVNQTTELRVLIALPESEGLRKHLPDYTEDGTLIRRQDVRSEAYADMLFDDENRPIQLYARPEPSCEDFEVITPARLVRLYFLRDSHQVTFLLKGLRPLFTAFVPVELYVDAECTQPLGSAGTASIQVISAETLPQTTSNPTYMIFNKSVTIQQGDIITVGNVINSNGVAIGKHTQANYAAAHVQ